jgi:hypothetical protein
MLSTIGCEIFNKIFESFSQSLLLPQPVATQTRPAVIFSDFGAKEIGFK